jgi:hypothetical protein
MVRDALHLVGELLLQLILVHVGLKRNLAKSKLRVFVNQDAKLVGGVEKRSWLPNPTAPHLVLRELVHVKASVNIFLRKKNIKEGAVKR